MIKLFFTISILVSCSSLKKIREDNSLFLDRQVRKKNRLFVSWTKNLDPAYKSGNLSISTSSPKIDGDFLYMGDQAGKMNAYEVDTGRRLWSVDNEQPINAKVGVYKSNIIYGSIYGRLYSRNKYNGKLVYAVDLGAPIESEPVFSKKKMFIHLRNHTIVCLDPKTGKLFWSYKRSIPFKISLQRVSRPFIYKDSIIVGFADGVLAKISQADGIILWETVLSNASKFIDVDTTPIEFNGHIVAGSSKGNLSFVNPSNGYVVRSLNIIAGTAPLVFGNELVVGSIFGELYLVDKSGQIKKSVKLSNSAISSIKVWKDSLVVSTMGQNIYVVDQFSFDLLQSRALGTEISSIFGFLESDSDNLAAFSSRNRLYVFKTK
ncbi:MAG: PQQ-like beta-propeller repeat protein [Bacteriovoracaceae bacterium]|jgi:outer membrane protein assembly factor BamB|nr:PQQ-like beta-propeller repeat protein [Bacteriovoracaceae bacterium]